MRLKPIVLVLTYLSCTSESTSVTRGSRALYYSHPFAYYRFMLVLFIE